MNGQTVQDDNKGVKSTTPTINAGQQKDPTEFLVHQGKEARPSHTILFVDDEPHVLRALKRAFADEEFEVLTAPDTAAALKIISG